MTINPAIDPKAIADMASKLNYQIDQSDLLASSADAGNSQDLDEAFLVKDDLAISKEPSIKDMLKGGNFKSAQSWANSSVKRILLATIAFGSLATALIIYANSKKSESSVVIAPPATAEDANKIDPMVKKVQDAEKAKSAAEVRGALGDQASSLTDSKDKKLDTDQKTDSTTDTKSSTPPQKEPIISATPASKASTPKTDTKPPVIVSAPKPTPSVLPLPSVRPIQIPSTPSQKQHITPASKASTPKTDTKPPVIVSAPLATLANLGNQSSSKPSIISGGKTEPAKTIIKLEKPKPAPLTTLDLPSTTKRSTALKADKTIKEVVASLGRQPERVEKPKLSDYSRSQTSVIAAAVPPTPINPQDLGSVGSLGNVVLAAGSVIQTAPPPPLVASNIGSNPSADQSVNRAWGIKDEVPQQPIENGLQPVNNSAANQVNSRGGIYTPPSLTDYFRDTAGASTPTTVTDPEKTPQILKVAFNPKETTKPLQNTLLPEVSPATKEVKADSPDDSKPITVAQNEANRLFSVGTSAKAVTLMPIIYGNKVQNVVPKYEIALVEPMTDKTSKVGFPVGTRFIVTPNGAASDIGEIQLDVISIKLPTNQEFTPPAGSIVVRAENGGLLLGEDYFNRGSQIASRNLNRVILGGLATVGSNANRPTVSISTIFGGAGNVTTNNAGSNFWLSILEGAAKEGLAIATEENQAAIKEALAAPKVFKLSKNLRVQVYTNNTIVF